MEMLQSALGRFYFLSHERSPPTFLQVVGWTKHAEKPDARRRYVYVRKIPLQIDHGLGGGAWSIDQGLVQRCANEITEPIQRRTNPLVEGSAILIPGAQFLRYQSQTIPIFNL